MILHRLGAIGFMSLNLLGCSQVLEEIMPAEREFSKPPTPDHQLIQQYDTEPPKNWLSRDEASRLMSTFDKNGNGVLDQGDERSKAVGFLARLYTYRENTRFGTTAKPLNDLKARLRLLEATYNMSTDTDQVHSDLVREIDAQQSNY